MLDVELVDEREMVDDERFRFQFDDRDLIHQFIGEWARTALRIRQRKLRPLLKRAFRGAGLSIKLISSVGPLQTVMATIEATSNKLFAVQSFRKVARRLGARPGDEANLYRLVRAACEYPPSDAIWLVEGLGFQFMRSACREGQTQTPVGRLSDVVISQLPTRSLIPLHVGAGLALDLGGHVEGLTDSSQPNEIRDALLRVISLSQRNTETGFQRIAVESLGFLAWCGRRPLVPKIAKVVEETDETLVGCFWHGVGRAINFSPGTFLPLANLGWPALDAARTVSPERIACANAVAGLAWAITLVNLRCPRIIDIFLQGSTSEQWEVLAIADGVRAATTLWLDWSQNTGDVQRLCEYQPMRCNRPHADWGMVVRQTCLDLLHRPSMEFRPRDQIDQIFQYQETCIAQ